MYSANKQHKFPVGAHVFTRNGNIVHTGTVHGWIGDGSVNGVERYLVALDGLNGIIRDNAAAQVELLRPPLKVKNDK